MSFAEQLREQHKARQNRLGISKAPVSFTRKPSVSTPITEQPADSINVPVNKQALATTSTEVPAPPSLVIPAPERVARARYKADSIARIRRDFDDLLSRLDYIESQPDYLPQKIKAKDIILAVCRFYNVAIEDILSARRPHALARPRHVAFYLIKKLTLLTLQEIGRAMGGRDHTTVMHGVERVSTALDTDADLASDIANLRSELEAANV